MTLRERGLPIAGRGGIGVFTSPGFYFDHSRRASWWSLPALLRSVDRQKLSNLNTKLKTGNLQKIDLRPLDPRVSCTLGEITFSPHTLWVANFST